MKISIVIPAYNEEKSIAHCLTSIEKEIAREMRGEMGRETGKEKIEFEVIVANNASTDKTKEEIATFPHVKVVDESRKGIVWARRAGYLASSGDIIANVDADTLMPTGWLAKVIREFSTDPELLALSGPYIYYDGSWLTQALIHFSYICGYVSDRINKFFSGNSFMLQGGNFVLRKEALEKIGGFDTSIEFYGEDIDIGRRVGKIGKIKWTFDFPMYSSARRFIGDGFIKTSISYVLNFFWISFTGKPFTMTHEDIRL